jgi:DNA-directed RNA polymerase subunit RPC12/RpoP
MADLPCFLCGKQLNQRTDKNNKPYFICNPCGMQIFIRRELGIQKLADLIRNLKEGELPLRTHTRVLYEVQAILSEMDDLKAEIKRLDGEIGFFWIDQDKLRARKLLEARIENLLLNLEQISEPKTSGRP